MRLGFLFSDHERSPIQSYSYAIEPAPLCAYPSHSFTKKYQNVMAKDPAFLFYDANVASDTKYMTLLQRGAYLEIIMAQKKFGPLTLDQIKMVLGSDFENCFPALKICLSYVDHMYVIEWLQESIEKRRKFTESRRKNREGAQTSKKVVICKSYEEDMTPHINNHMNGHMVNENININTDIDIERLKEEEGTGRRNHQGEEKVWKAQPGEEAMGLALPELTVETVIRRYRSSKLQDVEAEQVEDLWRCFKAQHFNGENFYETEKKAINHFVNWSKNQEIYNPHGTPIRASSGAKSKQDERERAFANFGLAGKGPVVANAG